jgi:hypothetical protein
MELIIISGKARVGKTTLANFLAKEAFELGFIPKLLSFADPLKKEALERGYSKEKDQEEYREFCQELGALRRQEKPSYWVDVFEEKLSEILEEEKIDLNKENPYWERCVIVDDCRYHNEVGLSIKHHATTIFISPGERTLAEEDAPWRNHHSEDMANAIEDGDLEQGGWFDYHLLNDGDVQALQIKARAMSPIWCGVSAAGLAKDLTDESLSSAAGNTEDMLRELLDILLKEFEDGEYDPPVSDDGSD